MRILLLLLFLSTSALAGPRSPCYWSGSVAQCFPSTGIMLHDNREMRLGETTANGTDYVSLKAPASVTTSYTLTFPAAVATGNDQFLLSSSTGTVSFSDTVTTAKQFNAGVRLRESGGGSDYIQLQAPSSISGNTTYTIPADGTDGQHLTTNGGGTLGWEWASSVTYTNANCSLSNTDGYTVVYMNTGSTPRTCALPTASSNTGRVITIKKMNTDTGVITVSGTIDGTADIKLYKTGESVTVQSDGTDWDLISATWASGNFTMGCSNAADFTSVSDTYGFYTRTSRDAVVVVGACVATNTDATRHIMQVNLPIANTFTADTEGGGVCAYGNGSAATTSASTGGNVFVDTASSTTTIRCRVWPPAASAAGTLSIQYSYKLN